MWAAPQWGAGRFLHQRAAACVWCRAQLTLLHSCSYHHNHRQPSRLPHSSACLPIMLKIWRHLGPPGRATAQNSQCNLRACTAREHHRQAGPTGCGPPNKHNAGVCAGKQAQQMHNCWQESISSRPAQQLEGARRCVRPAKKSRPQQGNSHWSACGPPACSSSGAESALWRTVSTVRQQALSTACGQRAADVEEM